MKRIKRVEKYHCWYFKIYIFLFLWVISRYKKKPQQNGCTQHRLATTQITSWTKLYAYAWVDTTLIFTRRHSSCNAQSFWKKQFALRLMYITLDIFSVVMYNKNLITIFYVSWWTIFKLSWRINFTIISILFSKICKKLLDWYNHT